ncbi:tripartite motif-containing protein [Anaeramoeba flamelloides]|uniref:Tripartite motif-containing protein n=1 Tax=Anaeramoeba flamelloides TaxID=1746091 RepID=A0ABQ8YZL4_9EUKA|nr:tripartite motif-containing protein [Anaeramoeba flamelloides]
MTSYFPIQQKEEQEEEEEIIWCDNCHEDNRIVTAKVYCHDCEKNLCENCDMIHQFPGYKSHIRDTKPNLDLNSTGKCPIHQYNKLSRWCKNCQKLICSECVFEHTNHETISFDQPMNFYEELIKEQKKCTRNHFERINERFEKLNKSEKEINLKKENFLTEISNFYLNQKNLLDLLEQNEIKLIKDFFEQISKITNKEKQTINNSKSSTQKLLNEFNKLESNINQSNSFGFFKLFSQMQLPKTKEKSKTEFPRLCNEHKNQAFKYFCLDHKQLLCVDCRTLNHRNCNQVVNLKEGYEKIQNELQELIKVINSINKKKQKFVQKIQNEKFKSLKEKQINMGLVKKNYQKINELTQYKFKKMNEEISIEQNEKFFKLNKQSMKIQKEFDNFNESEMIIKEIEICKKYNNYQQILINFFKLKKLLSILNKNKKLICNSKFIKINIISNDLKKNLKNWKLKLPFDHNKTQINLPNEIMLENKLKFSILLKNQFNETVNAQKFNPKVEILKSNSNEMITEITKFPEKINRELIGEYLFQEVGEYQINISINDQLLPKSPFKLKVIDPLFLEESEILQKENNPKFNLILKKWVKEAGCNSYLKRRFNSRTDGWRTQTFHEKCDNKGKSILLIKVKNNSLFGGFAAIDWDSTTYGYKQSIGNKSFLFSLISLDPNFKKPLKLHIYQSKQYEIYCHSDYAPIFGGGSCDLQLGDDKKNMKEYNYSDLGTTYQVPFGYLKQSRYEAPVVVFGGEGHQHLANVLHHLLKGPRPELKHPLWVRPLISTPTPLLPYPSPPPSPSPSPSSFDSPSHFHSSSPSHPNKTSFSHKPSLSLSTSPNPHPFSVSFTFTSRLFTFPEKVGDSGN